METFVLGSVCCFVTGSTCNNFPLVFGFVVHKKLVLLANSKGRMFYLNKVTAKIK